jgi:prepilin-type processing-associated H-X9-DG protein
MSNLRQIGLGMMQYVQDYDGKYPMASYSPAVVSTQVGTPAGKYTETPIPSAPGEDHFLTWMDFVFPYVKSLAVYDCPSRAVPLQVPLPGEPASWYGGVTSVTRPSYSQNDQVFLGNNKGLSESAIVGASEKIVLMHSDGSPYVYTHPNQYAQYAADTFSDAGGSDAGGHPGIYSYSYQRMRWPHNDTGNMLFADGHVKNDLRRATGKWTCDGSPTCGYWDPTVAPPD